MLQVLDNTFKYRKAQVQLTWVPTTCVNQYHSSEKNTPSFEEPASHSPPQAIVLQSSFLEADVACLNQLQVAAILLSTLSVLEAQTRREQQLHRQRLN